MDNTNICRACLDPPMSGPDPPTFILTLLPQATNYTDFRPGRGWFHAIYFIPHLSIMSSLPLIPNAAEGRGADNVHHYNYVIETKGDA